MANELATNYILSHGDGSPIRQSATLLAAPRQAHKISLAQRGGVQAVRRDEWIVGRRDWGFSGVKMRATLGYEPPPEAVPEAEREKARRRRESYRPPSAERLRVKEFLDAAKLIEDADYKWARIDDGREAVYFEKSGADKINKIIAIYAKTYFLGVEIEDIASEAFKKTGDEKFLQHLSRAREIINESHLVLGWFTDHFQKALLAPGTKVRLGLGWLAIAGYSIAAGAILFLGLAIDRIVLGKVLTAGEYAANVERFRGLLKGGIEEYVPEGEVRDKLLKRLYDISTEVAPGADENIFPDWLSKGNLIKAGLAIGGLYALYKLGAWRWHVRRERKVDVVLGKVRERRQAERATIEAEEEAAWERQARKKAKRAARERLLLAEMEEEERDRARYEKERRRLHPAAMGRVAAGLPEAPSRPQIIPPSESGERRRAGYRRWLSGAKSWLAAVRPG